MRSSSPLDGSPRARADRDLGGGEHSAPLGRSGMEMPDSGQLDEGGTPSRDRPPADLAGSSSSLAGLSRGASGYSAGSASIVGISRKKKLLAFSHSPDHSGRSGDLGLSCRGSRRSRRSRSPRTPSPFPPWRERGSLASAGEPFFPLGSYWGLVDGAAPNWRSMRAIVSSRGPKG